MGKGQGLQNQFYEPRRGRWLIAPYKDQSQTDKVVNALRKAELK